MWTFFSLRDNYYIHKYKIVPPAPHLFFFLPLITACACRWHMLIIDIYNIESHQGSLYYIYSRSLPLWCKHFSHVIRRSLLSFNKQSKKSSPYLNTAPFLYTKFKNPQMEYLLRESNPYLCREKTMSLPLD